MIGAYDVDVGRALGPAQRHLDLLIPRENNVFILWRSGAASDDRWSAKRCTRDKRCEAGRIGYCVVELLLAVASRGSTPAVGGRHL
jgi:hypothetical protein